MDFIVGIGKFLFILLQVILVFNLMILVHEWGHFLAARWRGLVVEKFYIWFGKPIWKKTINGVEYGLGSIPAGGFVALPQMAPMEMLEGKTDAEGKALAPISSLDKIIVAFAGPLFSLGLAFVFACLVFVFGKPVSESAVTNTIGSIDPDLPAAEVLQLGDVVKKIDGVEVHGFFSTVDGVMERIVHSRGDTVQVVVERDGKEFTFDIAPHKKDTKAWERSDIRRLGIGPKTSPVVGSVFKDSPAALAGIQKDDLFVKLEGKPIHDKQEISEFIKQHGTKPIRFTVLRGGQEVECVATPQIPIESTSENPTPMLGVAWNPIGIRSIEKPSPSPFKQVAESGTVLFRTIGSLFSAKSDINASHLSGPIGIGTYYYDILSDPNWGWRLALWFSVLLNVNLAVMNMLPFPVLDGGHITIAIMEAIRRRPVNTRILEYVQAACALLLIGFMLFVTFHDGSDLVRRNSKKDKSTIKFAPPDAPVVKPDTTS